MQATLDTQDIQTRQDASPINKVMGYRNSAVLDRIKKDCELDSEQARTVFMDMLMFLYLCGASDVKPVSPPPLIDEAWHTFIIFTEDYARFCKQHFGRFIHHRPNRPGESHDNTGLKNCGRLVTHFFGSALSKNWDATRILEAQGDCKGACDGCSKGCKGFGCNVCNNCESCHG